ncbi:helix-turn-helix domain-containing protein [Clostridioides difficile]
MADILGLSSYGFRLKLKGKNEFKASEIKKISKLYNVSADYFFQMKLLK